MIELGSKLSKLLFFLTNNVALKFPPCIFNISPHTLQPIGWMGLLKLSQRKGNHFSSSESQRWHYLNFHSLTNLHSANPYFFEVHTILSKQALPLLQLCSSDNLKTTPSYFWILSVWIKSYSLHQSFQVPKRITQTILFQ